MKAEKISLNFDDVFCVISDKDGRVCFNLKQRYGYRLFDDVKDILLTESQQYAFLGNRTTFQVTTTKIEKAKEYIELHKDLL